MTDLQELVQLHAAARLSEPRPSPSRNYPDAPPGYLAVPAEESAWRRFSPKRRGWQDVAAFDDRVLELDKRAEAVRAQSATVHEQLLLAPKRDAEALADAQLSGGKNPVPTVPGLKEQRDSLERELAGLGAANAKVLAEKVDYVQRHRKRLTKDAEKHTEQAARRYRQLVDELERARADLSDARSTTLWAQLYPGQTNLLSVPRRGFAGDLRQPLTRAGLSGSITTEHVFDLLRVDADWLEHAASSEQRQAVGEKRESDAVWLDTEEGEKWRQRQQIENNERIARARRQGTWWEEG
jgi:hypothetical protein